MADHLEPSDEQEHLEASDEQDYLNVDPQEAANTLQARAAAWHGDVPDLRDIIDGVTDLVNDPKAIDTVEEICHDLRAHPIPTYYYVWMTVILAQIAVKKGEWVPVGHLADSANETLEEIEGELQTIFGGDDYDWRVKELRKLLDEVLRDLVVHDGAEKELDNSFRDIVVQEDADGNLGEGE